MRKTGHHLDPDSGALDDAFCRLKAAWHCSLDRHDIEVVRKAARDVLLVRTAKRTIGEVRDAMPWLSRYGSAALRHRAIAKSARDLSDLLRRDASSDDFSLQVKVPNFVDLTSRLEVFAGELEKLSILAKRDDPVAKILRGYEQHEFAKKVDRAIRRRSSQNTSGGRPRLRHEWSELIDVLLDLYDRKSRSLPKRLSRNNAHPLGYTGGLFRGLCDMYRFIVPEASDGELKLFGSRVDAQLTARSRKNG